MQLSTVDVLRLSDACLELFSPGLDVASWNARTFAFLSTLVSAELYAFGSLHRRTALLDIAFSADRPEMRVTMQAFGNLMGKYQLFNWDPAVAEGRPFCRDDFFSARQFRDLDVYCEVYRPLGIDDHCAVHVPLAGDEVLFFGIERSGTTPFSERDRALLTLAQPHLANARHLALIDRSAMREALDPVLLQRAGFPGRVAEVLCWLAEGKSNAEIAGIMGLRLQTVKGYVAEIFNRAGVGNRLAATLWALDLVRQQGGTRVRENAIVVPSSAASPLPK